MHDLRRHIIFKGLTLLVVVIFLLPFAVKSMHVFENHKHEVCYGEVDAHFHTLDHDCEFYNFNINIAFTFPLILPSVQTFPKVKGIILSDYYFLSDYQRLNFSLRGPPSINLI